MLSSIINDQEYPDDTVAGESRGGDGGYMLANGSDHVNFLLMWGCRPSLGVKIDTKMVKNVVDTLMNKFDRINLSVKLPEVFEQLKGSDAMFEMVTSNTIQPLNLLYQHNIARTKYVAIVVNSNTRKLTW